MFPNSLPFLYMSCIIPSSFMQAGPVNMMRFHSMIRSCYVAQLRKGDYLGGLSN